MEGADRPEKEERKREEEERVQRMSADRDVMTEMWNVRIHFDSVCSHPHGSRSAYENRHARTSTITSRLCLCDVRLQCMWSPAGVRQTANSPQQFSRLNGTIQIVVVALRPLERITENGQRASEELWKLHCREVQGRDSPNNSSSSSSRAVWIRTRVGKNRPRYCCGGLQGLGLCTVASRFVHGCARRGE